MKLQKSLLFVCVGIIVFFQGMPSANAGTVSELLTKQLDAAQIQEIERIVVDIFMEVEAGQVAGQHRTDLITFLKSTMTYLDKEIPIRQLTVPTRAEALRVNSLVKSLLYRRFNQGDSFGTASFADIHAAWMMCARCAKVNYGYGIAVFIMDLQLSGGLIAQGKRKAVEMVLGVGLTAELDASVSKAWNHWSDVQNLIFGLRVYQFQIRVGRMALNQQVSAALLRLEQRIAELKVTQARQAQDAEINLAAAIKGK